MLIIRLLIFILLFSLLLLLLPASAWAETAPAVQAQACIVLCADGGVLYAKNADSRCLIASTTKLMTALVCLENAALDDSFTAQARHCAVEGSSMYLKAGERYTVRELLLGLLLASGNDAALALAEHTAGSEAAFVRMMNEKAQALGLQNTHFENPHGLDAPDHYSTARDLAVLMCACMQSPAFRALNALAVGEAGGQTLVNHNRLLSLCPGCIGGKTGYTGAAGRCLVSCCAREGMELVCVTLSDPDDWNDHMRLYDWAYGNYALHDLHAELAFAVPVISGSRAAVRAVPAPGSRLVLPRDRDTELCVELPRFAFAPVTVGETAGTLSYWKEDECLARFPLVYAEDAVLADPVFGGYDLMTERIQKLISAAGLMSRRTAEDAISAGRVRVNGERASLGDKADPALDRITVDGKALPQQGEKLYLMLNKPRGYVTTLHDEKGRRSVTELVGDLGSRVYPVGRLDMYSEGLLFLTNDGDFANRVMHPSHELDKVYHTWVTGENVEKAAHRLRRPMDIDGCTVRARGVDIVQCFPGGALLSITIGEGRNRQVRRMCEQAGLKVTRLLRVQEGGVELGELKSGSWRYLRREEIERLLGKGEK